MTTYSLKERQIAKAMNNMPLLKKFLKRGYTFLNYSIYGLSKPRVVSAYCINRIGDCLCDKWRDYETFWGYYDKYPMNKSGLVLLNATLHPTKKKPSANYAIHVLLVNIEYREVLLDIETKAYNWQQGCRAHWLNDELFILNDFDADRRQYVARVFSASQLVEMDRFDYHVQNSFSIGYFLFY